MNPPKIDVFIPVYKPDEKLGKLLKALKYQDLPVNTVWLLLTEADTYPMPRFPEGLSIMLYTIPKEQFDHAGSRNYISSFSDADFFVFMTQDAVPKDRKLTEELHKAFTETPDCTVSYARQLPGEESDTMERISRSFNYPPVSEVKRREDMDRLGIKSIFCSDVCAMYLAKRFREAGGFEAPAVFNEDMIYAYHELLAGNAVCYQAGARVLHAHKSSFRGMFLRSFDLGVSQKDRSDIFSSFSSEKEGGRLVKAALSTLLRRGRVFEALRFTALSAVRYAGYLMGKNYTRLPRNFVQKLSSIPVYFEKR